MSSSYYSPSSNDNNNPNTNNNNNLNNNTNTIHNTNTINTVNTNNSNIQSVSRGRPSALPSSSYGSGAGNLLSSGSSAPRSSRNPEYNYSQHPTSAAASAIPSSLPNASSTTSGFNTTPAISSTTSLGRMAMDPNINNVSNNLHPSSSTSHLQQQQQQQLLQQQNQATYSYNSNSNNNNNNQNNINNNTITNNNSLTSVGLRSRQGAIGGTGSGPLPKTLSETSGYNFANSSIGAGNGGIGGVNASSSMIRSYNNNNTFNNPNQQRQHQQQQHQQHLQEPTMNMNMHNNNNGHNIHAHVLLNPSQSMTTVQSSIMGGGTSLTNGMSTINNHGGHTNKNNGSGAMSSSKLKRMTFCGLCSAYDLNAEKLEYNYALEHQQLIQQQHRKLIGGLGPDGSVTSATLSGGGPVQPYPRIRARGEFYIDTFNDEPWSWSMGTNEQNGTWCNSSDQAGTIMSAMVWVLMLYSALTVTLLTVTDGIPVTCGMTYSLLVFMSLSSHAKTSFTDPGSVPVQAIPSERQRMLRDSHSMCGQCQTFKPPGSHHCRICNRCISRMDHHCPWMNNCVGAGNLKHFCLFLIYTWLCAAYSLTIFGWNYFFCSDEACTFHPVVLHLVRLMTLLAVGAFLFTSSMLMNVCYGIMTGIGTIDRLKKKATNTMSQSDEEPIQLIDVFGIGGYWTWPLPMIDPIFDEYDRVMGYTMPSRLDRERQFCDLVQAQHQQQLLLQQGGGGVSTTMGTNNSNSGVKPNPSMDFPIKCVNDLLPV